MVVPLFQMMLLMTVIFGQQALLLPLVSRILDQIALGRISTMELLHLVTILELQVHILEDLRHQISHLFNSAYLQA